jgi:phospholipid/cholesterol/gamma-HCH transport system ATP-binding protein
LDPLLAKSIHDLIVSTQKKFGFTAVMVSHEIPEVFGISHCVAMLLNGKIAEMSPAEGFVRTTNGEIREFITAGGTISLDNVMTHIRERS